MNACLCFMLFTSYQDGVKKSSIIKPPSKLILEPGDVLRCSADGNPPPSTRWKDLLDNSTTEGEEYTVKACNRSRLVLQCTNKNIISNKEYSSSASITLDVKFISCDAQKGYGSTTDKYIFSSMIQVYK